MKINITVADNGFILRVSDQIAVYENDSSAGLVALLYDISDILAEDSSRYSPSRIRILDVPGDKYEGEWTNDQIEMYEYLMSIKPKKGEDSNGQ